MRGWPQGDYYGVRLLSPLIRLGLRPSHLLPQGEKASHQNPLRPRLTSAPPASINSTCSGIWPMAWVAQDRQGS